MRNATMLPALEDGDVHLWSVDLDGGFGLEQGTDVLSNDERDRAERLLSPTHRRRWETSRVALRQVLARYCGIEPAAIAFAVGPYGKPELQRVAGESTPQFSLSHSEGLALVAVATHPVGVDLERLRQLEVSELATRFFSGRESAAILAERGPTRLSLFLRCWTRKEAYLKAIGIGLSAALTDFDVDLRPHAERALFAHRRDAAEPGRWSLLSPETHPAYAAAIVLKGQPRCLHHFIWGEPSVIAIQNAGKDQ